MDEYQRRARPMTTHNMSSRTISLDQNHYLNHSRPLRNSSERSPIHNFERRHITPIHSGLRNRGQSASNMFPRVRINSERSTRASRAYQRTSTMNQNPSESDQQDATVESSSQSNVSIEERLACGITMSYASTTTIPAENSSREEIAVMQRYSTGETSLVYQGYLTKGESFSFKSQRRPTSSLSLAFYVQGTLDNVTSECCEFKCVQKISDVNDQKQFHFVDIQKANPCENCRKEYATKLSLNNGKNTLLVQRHKKVSQHHDQSNKNLKSSFADDHVEEKESAKKHQQQKKDSKYEKTKSNLPQSTTTQASLVHTAEIPVVSTVQSTEKPETNPQDSNQTETTTTTDNEIDVGLFIQMLAAHFKQNTSASAQQYQLSRMKRHPKSVENFCYILESHVVISTDEQQTLRGLINLGFTFDDINGKECIDFLKKILNEKIILILSKASMNNLTKPIQDEPLLSAIYVIDSSVKNSFDSKFYRGSFPDVTRLCEQLKSDLQPFSYDLTSICSIPTGYTGMSTLNYVQVLKDILLENDKTRDLKREMIDFCREEYADNILQLKFIDEFANHFQPDDAIQWYLRHETFLYKMLTRAFRVLDPDILFKLRYFIQHLHSQLKSDVKASPLTVYRTVRIEKKLFDKMKRNQGALLSFNEFLLANKNQSTIEPSPLNTDSKLVHFKIVLETGVSRHDITTKPNEVLLTAGTVFRIDKVEQIDEETFTAELTTNDEAVKAGQLITNDLRDAVRAPFPLVRMVKLMKARELTGYMEYFCSMLFDDPQTVEDETANLTLGGLLHSLGTHYYEAKQYEQALHHLQNSLKVYLRVLPDNDVKLTPTYNNIGSIYRKQGLDEQALEYHQKAYEIQKASPDPDMDSIGAYVGNIASVLMKLGRYKEAVSYLEFDLQIKQKLHPNNDHAEVATRYHNLAGGLYRLHEYSKAVENYQKCLDIELKCHSNENPTVAVTYFNMATALEELGQLQEAKEAVENAIARLLLTKKPDDEEVQRQRKYLQRLEQKIWMKTLFATT